MKKEYMKIEKNKILEEYDSNINGLKDLEVKRRLKKYGKNELPREKRKTILATFMSALNDPIIYVLIVCAILSFIVGETIDALAIIFIIMVDAIVSTIQEYKAESNAEALRNLIKFKSKVIRNSKHFEIESENIVPGDILILEPGSQVSADGIILTYDNLTINESILTGESIGVVKSDNSKNDNNKVYAGTSVMTGRAIVVVTSTGINTEVGKIAQKVTNTKETKSPLTIRMEKFSKQITFIILVISLLIAVVLYYKGYDTMEIFLSVVALGVSAMPEGLPLALTMALTIGSNKMGKRNVIVKKLNSVESLGSCTVIASDKTGTLTVNEQTAKKIVLCNNEEFNISGTGYNNLGEITPLKNSKIENANYIAKLGSINNDAFLEKKDNDWNSFGDSIDIAFLSLGKKAKIDLDEYKIIYEIPYESEKKYSASFYELNGKTYCTVKGSIEVILNFCNHNDIDTKKIKFDKDKILLQNENLALDGYRVIAICNGEVKKKIKYNESDLNNLGFVGLVGFIDPVRKEAIKSIKECKLAGIKVLMITGDHALTAESIAKELKLIESKNEVITSQELEEYIDNEEQFDKLIANKKVFARVTPLQKLKIVESLQRQGEFVAVTGDGVNDAPAIKAANIGIAMGSGTDVAKETANMIIIDDNFSSIVAGIEEGRNAYSNIRKITLMLLSCGLAEVLFFVLAIVANLPIPLVAIQLLWLNLVTDGLQDMALSFERETDTIMREKPRNTNESLFEKELIKQILISGIFIGVLVFLVWSILINKFSMEASHARGYVLALMVFIQNIHVINCRSEKKSIFNNSFKTNLFVLFTIFGSILLQVLVMEIPFLSKLLQTYKVPTIDMIILFLISLPVLLVMEMYKRVKNNN